MSKRPEVDFYILQTTNGKQAYLFTCQLIETFYSNQQTVFINTSSQQEADYLDGLLWTYKDISFLPHHLYNETLDYQAPILIGWQVDPSISSPQVLINFAQEIPAYFSLFDRVIEIVFNDAPMQQLARERYRRYRDEKCEINTYKT